jgi:hypothetical protein
LLLGDSFAEGIGVAYPSTFAGRLADQANALGLDVLNGSVSSYSPIIYWRKAIDLTVRRGVRIDEVVVFLDISDIQDEANYRLAPDSTVRHPRAHGFLRVPTRDELMGIAPTDGWARRAVAWLRLNTSLTHRLLHRLRNGFLAPQGGRANCEPPVSEWAAECRAGWTSDERIMAGYGRVGLSAASQHMTALAELLAAHGIPLTVVVYPWPQQLRWGDRTSTQVTHWRAWSAENHARFIELFTDFFAEVDALGVDRTLDSLFIRGDVHLTPAGHAVFERRFVQRYCAASLAGAPARAPLEARICRETPGPAPVVRVLPTHPARR